MSTQIEAPQLAELLAELDQEALASTIARAAGVAGIASWSAAIARPIDGCVGYAARKALVAFAFVDGDGRAGRVELALKHFAGWKGGGESPAYRWLESVGAPVPRLAGALKDRRGDEVILLELLPHLGYDPAVERDLEALLWSLARLNALTPPPPGVAHDPPQDISAMASGAVAYFPRLAADALRGAMGEEVRELIADGQRLWPLLATYFAPIVADLEALPEGTIHGDTGAQNTGRRADRRELLLFDLHKLQRGRIHWDVALTTMDVGGARDDRLSRFWLAELRRAGGPAIEEDALARGRLAHNRMRSASMWWWQHHRSIDGAVDWTSDRDEGRKTYRGWLASSVRTLRDDLAARARGSAGVGAAP